MKPASGPSNSVALVSSLDVEKAGPTTPEFATVFITSAARAASGVVSPSWMSSGFVEFSSMMEPPADSTSALSHTVRDSARRPWALRSFCCSWAAVTSWSQVTGWVMSSPAASATDLRYQSSWVLAQNGMATSSPSHVAESIELCTTPSVTRSARSPGTGARKPACANSGMYGGSRLIRSIEVSLAASRRTSCSRWAEDSRGSCEVSMVYAPFEASLHRWAISAWPPESGLMYQLRTGTEPPDRKSTRLNSSHANISYAVFCLKKKNTVMHSL